MRENDKLTILSALDDGLLEQTLNRRAALMEKPRGKMRWIRYVALAACLLLVLGVTLFLGRMIGGIRNDPFRSNTLALGPSTPAEKHLGIGSTVTSPKGYGTLTFFDESDTTVTLILEKATDDELHFHMEGRVKTETIEGKNNTYYRYQRYIASTDPDLWVWRCTVLTDVLHITVNDIPSENGQLPQEAGIYTIVVDFSRFLAMDGMTVGDFRITGFDVMERNGELTTYDALTFSPQERYYDRDTKRVTEMLLMHLNPHTKKAYDYLDALYLSCDSEELIGVSALGRELPTEVIDGKTYYVLDTAEPDSSYGLQTYLFLDFAYTEEAVSQRCRVKLSCYLNGVEEENAFRLIYDTNPRYAAEENFPRVYATPEDVPEVFNFVLPTVLPTRATLVNQIYCDPDSNFLSLSYRTDDPYQDFSLRVSDYDYAFGDQKTEYVTKDGIAYKIVTEDAGYDDPPIHIVWWEYKRQYSFTANVRQAVDSIAIIDGLDHTRAYRDGIDGHDSPLDPLKETICPQAILAPALPAGWLLKSSRPS